MKINFKHPKYIVPLIILPFAFLGFFVMGGKTKAAPQAKAIQQEGMNTQMPGVDSGISHAQIKDKFAAYQAAFKNVTDSSVMGSVSVTGQSGGLNYQSVYTAEDLQKIHNQQKIDSIKNAIHESQSKIQKQFAGLRSEDDASNPSASGQPSYYQQELDGYHQWQQANNQQLSQSAMQSNAGDNNEYSQQMQLFKDQMKYLDNTQAVNGGASNGKVQGTSNGEYTKNGLKKWRAVTGKDSSDNALPVALADKKDDRIFNTVSNTANDDNNITAMIDEDVKASLGSRVRIRLLKDIYVGDNLVKKGSYIYGVVTGFQKQRVNISIAWIMNDHVSLPVKMDVYDNDGYIGLYVPGSDFREFTKEIGSTASQGMSTTVTPDGSDVKTSILSQLFNTTTTTMANLIKKDKAFLKYNYIVFLKENKE